MNITCLWTYFVILTLLEWYIPMHQYDSKCNVYDLAMNYVCEIRINEAAGRGDSDSWMTSFEVIMPLKLQSTMKALL